MAIFHHFFANRFIRNSSWIGVSELMARVSRLLTAIILARFLSLEEFGIAALAITVNELVKVFNQNGIGAKIIQAPEAELEAVCNTAYRLNWMVCGSLFVLQCLLAFPLSWFYQQADLIPMVMLLAVVYLFMPSALVQAFLIQRQNRLKVTALVAGVQVTVDNLLTALLAALGLGAWAVVLPKLLVAPIWVIGTRMNQYWRFDPHSGFAHWREILHFGKHVLGVELLKTLRLNLDNLIIGRFLGIEALGIYSFARNAGLGISLSLSSAFNTALFPHLCEGAEDRGLLRKKFLHALKIIAWVMIPLILLQSLLAPWYVPIVFGEKWQVAVPVLLLLCLSAIPRPFGEGAAEVMRVLNKPHIDFYWSSFFSLLFLAIVFISLPWGINGVALGILLIHLIALPAYTVWVVRHYLH
ncbi:lipopolysaccharide biosynthesis protein [Candidatus Venteria ishoeyi]|uniref:Teichuronic acid biosynthesis protein TuaB n=1 Tax=Candidatus Venteria ishoeyi TaxID=1899563 RepID=A0A1H6FD86_9GAMM|nr:lipopolysaccharide biosynthesis protein [Candidatus Venteria ishoeyi]SEH07126.1 Teichuronic acid biosynthesis protein TuaB [Candidatus Venteria ishoeyi]